MKTGNAAFELADRRAEEERTAGILRSQGEVNRVGRYICVDCPLPIDDARRQAAPFAERCLDCQRVHEFASRRRA